MITPGKLKLLTELVDDARKLTGYQGGPIQIFMEVIDELRLDALELRTKLVKADKLANSLGTYLHNNCYHCDDNIELMPCTCLNVPSNNELIEALKEYRGET